MSEERFINIRKLAALDLYFRGSRFILLEFGFAVFVLGGVGAYAAFFSSGRPAVDAVVGIYLILLAIDYLPLFVYAVGIAKTHSAKSVVAIELAGPLTYRRKYGVQQSLVLVPLAVPILALTQEARRGAESPASRPPLQ